MIIANAHKSLINKNRLNETMTNKRELENIAMWIFMSILILVIVYLIVTGKGFR